MAVFLDSNIFKLDIQASYAFKINKPCCNDMYPLFWTNRKGVHIKVAGVVHFNSRIKMCIPA